MKRVITLTAAVFCALLLFSQGINKRFTLDGLPLLHKAVRYVDGHYYLFGSCSDLNFTDGLKGYVIKADIDGNFVDSMFIKIPGRTKIDIKSTRVYVTTDSAFLITGATLGTGGMRLLLCKISKQLDVLFLQEYDGVNSFTIGGLSAKENADKSIFVTGVTALTTFDSETVLLKTDSAGNELWRQLYGVSNLNDWGRNIISLPNSNILIAGDSERPGTNGGNVYTRTYLIETDSLGNLVWEWRDPDTSTTGALAFIQTNDGGFVGVGSYVTSRSKPNGSLQKPYLVKFNNSKQKVWEKQFLNQWQAVYATDVVELVNGDMLVCGTMVDNSIDNRNRLGFISKFSPTGTVIWHKFYKGVDSSPKCCGENTLYDLEVLPDGSIIAAGQADNSNINPNQQGWLLHIDSNGCLLSGSCGVTAIEVFPSPLVGFVKAYPNPVSNTLNIQLQNFNYLPDELIVLNTTGRIVFRQNIESDNFSINVSPLPQGIYVAQLISETQAIAFKKFVKD